MWNDMTTAQRISAIDAVLTERPGASATEISAVIAGANRNAVLGVISRNHALFPTYRRRPPAPKTPHAKASTGGGGRAFKIAEARKHSLSTVDAMELVLGKPKVDSIARYAAAFEPIPGTTPVVLTALQPGACKWPIGEKPTLFCGLATTTGRYCPTHEQRSGVRLPAVK